MVKEKNKNACNGASSAFSGSGKLTEKKDTSTGSWIMDQMKKGYEKCDRGISVSDDGGRIRFAALESKIASEIISNSEEFKIVKTYKRLSSSSRNDFRFAMKWFIYGSFNGSTIEDLNLVSALLQNRVQNDISKITPAYKMTTDYLGVPTIDFEKDCLMIDGIASFEVNIITDASKITGYLEKLGFSSAATAQVSSEEI